jgi:hypothetical protein
MTGIFVFFKIVRFPPGIIRQFVALAPGASDSASALRADAVLCQTVAMAAPSKMRVFGRP